MLLSRKYTLYEKITSASSTLDEVKSIIQSYPEMLSFSFSHVFPLDRLCMKKTSHPDIIIYLVEQGAKIDTEEERRKKASHKEGILVVGDTGNGISIGSSTRGGLVRDMRMSMPPLKMLIYNDRLDVLKKLSEMDPPMLYPQDVIEYHLLHFAVGHCRPDWVAFFVKLNPKAVNTRDNGLLPIQLCSKEWHKNPDLFWDVFSVLLRVGVEQQVGGEEGFGGLLVPTPPGNVVVSLSSRTIVPAVFKSSGVTWEKISRLIQDKNARSVLVHQLVKGNIIGKQHFNDIVHSFQECLCVKDAHGRLPIHVASERGISWMGGMNRLVETNLSLIEIPDEVTGLFPFALAAVGETNDLQCIFELLRRFPEGVTT